MTRRAKQGYIIATPRMTRDIDLVVALSAADSARIRDLFEPDYYYEKTNEVGLHICA
jgi:hypothetical protein